MTNKTRKEIRKTYYDKHKQRLKLDPRIVEWRAKGKIYFKKWWDKIREGRICVSCGENHPSTLDYHHVDPNEKEYNITKLAKNHSKKKLEAELKKCVTLCANCHRLLHYEGEDDDRGRAIRARVDSFYRQQVSQCQSEERKTEATDGEK